MTKLLVSVRDAAEAEIALEAGADIIDVKEPKLGSLGASSLRDIAAVLESTSAKLPVSVACGELADADVGFVSKLPSTVSFAKLGLAGCRLLGDWKIRWGEVLSYLPENVHRVAVAYADWQACNAPSPTAIIQRGAELDCSYFLIDTHSKASALLDLTTHKTVARWVSQARVANLSVVVAGSLGPKNFSDIVNEFRPFAIAVRGAACAGQREGDVCGKKVEQLKATLRCADQDAAICDKLS